MSKRVLDRASAQSSQVESSRGPIEEGRCGRLDARAHYTGSRRVEMEAFFRQKTVSPASLAMCDGEY